MTSPLSKSFEPNKTYQGLSAEKAKERLKKYGANLIQRRKTASGLLILVSQFTSPLILVLLGAAGVTYYLRDWVDTYVILAAVALNTFLGFYQEYRAHRGLQALKNLLSPQATVVREGKKFTLLAAELVPGDLAVLNAGDTVPADGVLLEAKNLLVNEAILTGESYGVEKGFFAEADWHKIRDAFASIVERNSGKDEGSSVYMGTTIQAGYGLMVVVHTGHKTELGEIATTLAVAKRDDTPLQLRLKKLSGFLTATVMAVAVLIFTVEIFTLSVAVAVSAIPEGLAVSLTAILAIGMQRILKRKALVRTLLAAEVLGSVTVICCDKTGTLTEGEMKVTKAIGDDTKTILLAAILGNDMHDPLEVGMWQWANKQVREGALKAEHKKATATEIADTYKLTDRLPFDAKHRYSAKLFSSGLYVIGAPEILLGFSNLSSDNKKKWEALIIEEARLGLRVVGFAFKRVEVRGELKRVEAEKDLTYLGLLVYEDPVRAGVAEALRAAGEAGVAVKVITGDYAETARGVLRQLGIEISDKALLLGDELEQMSDRELLRKVGEIALFARITPKQKLKIVEAIQARGEVVAMTGDGVNDAPALKKADIGIVVATASDVSKETADMVLLDSKFSTILAAVEEGRGIFDNLRKIVLYLLADAFTEIIVVVCALLFGMPLPITAAQILWVNLIDDGLPNLALTIDPKANGLLKRKPRGKFEPIIDSEMRWLIGLVSTVSAFTVLGIFWWYSQHKSFEYARTMAFVCLGMESLFYVFSSRSLSVPIWKDRLFSNRWLWGAVGVGILMQMVVIYVPSLARVFQTVPLAGSDLALVVLMGLVVMVLVEVVKWIFMGKATTKLVPV